MSSAGIETYLGEACIHPAIHATGHSRRHAARPGLPPHSHACHEICIVQDGVVMWHCEGEEHDVGPNEVFITKPHEIHGSRVGALQPCTLTWIQVTTDALTDRRLSEEFGSISLRRWPSEPEWIDHIRAIHRELARPAPDSIRIMEARLVLLLSLLIRSARRAGTQGAPRPTMIAALEEYLDERAGERVTVEQLSAHAGLTRSGLHALFRRHLGQSPRDYLTEHRLHRARAVVAGTDRPITEIALDLGYSSSQHFATAFRRRFGMSPSTFRRMHVGPEVTL